MKTFNPSQALSELNSFFASMKNPASFQEVFDERKFSSPSAELGFFFPEINGMVFVRKYQASKNLKYTAKEYIKKQKKPIFYYAFDNIESIEEYVNQWAENLIKRQKAKDEAEQKRKAQKDELLKELKNAIPLGSVFICSWGYEQTNVDYYQVIGYKGKKTLLLKEIGKTDVEQYPHMAGRCKPVIDSFLKDEILTKQVELSRNHNIIDGRIRMNSYSSAYLKHKDRLGEYESDYYSSYY